MSSETINDVPWTSLPLRQPTVFSNILVQCSPRDLLSCRSTCTAWYSWFSASNSIWTKMFEVMKHSIHNKLPDSLNVSDLSPENYRLIHLLSLKPEGEKESLLACLRLQRAQTEKCPRLDGHTMVLVGNLETKVKVLGPPAIFVRLKVNHPVVHLIVKETINRLLGAVILDKRDNNKDVVKRAILRSMVLGQNWAHVDFTEYGQNSQGDNRIGDGAQVLPGDQLEEALKLSMQQAENGDLDERGEKRKDFAEDENKEEDNHCKRLKLDADSNPHEEDEIEETEDVQPIEYNDHSDNKVHPDFPTVLELLDIDHPIVRNLLVKRCNIDCCLVVPQFEKFLHYPSLLDKETGLKVLGRDTDGQVSSVNPQGFNSCDSSVLGYVEVLNSIGLSAEINSWSGPDIRNRWPEFTKHLDFLDKVGDDVKTRFKKKIPMNVAVGPSVEVNKEEVKNNDIMALLASRGITVSNSKK